MVSLKVAIRGPQLRATGARLRDIRSQGLGESLAEVLWLVYTAGEVHAVLYGGACGTPLGVRAVLCGGARGTLLPPIKATLGDTS